MTAEYGLELHLTFVDELTASVDDGTFQAALISAGNLSVLGTTVLAVNETKVAIAEDTSVIFSWDGDPSDLAAALADDGGGGGGGSKDDDGADNAGFDFMYVIIGLIALLGGLTANLARGATAYELRQRSRRGEPWPPPNQFSSAASSSSSSFYTYGSSHVSQNTGQCLNRLAHQPKHASPNPQQRQHQRWR